MVTQIPHPMTLPCGDGSLASASNPPLNSRELHAYCGLSPCRGKPVPTGLTRMNGSGKFPQGVTFKPPKRGRNINSPHLIITTDKHLKINTHINKTTQLNVYITGNHLFTFAPVIRYLVTGQLPRITGYESASIRRRPPPIRGV